MELAEQFFHGLESWAAWAVHGRIWWWLSRPRSRPLVPAGQRRGREGVCTQVSGLADTELFWVLSARLESSASTELCGEGAPAGKCKAVSLGNIIHASLAQDGTWSWQLGLGKRFWVVTDHLGTPLAQCAGAAQKVDGSVCHLEGWRRTCGCAR